MTGSRVETRRLSTMGQGESTCTAPTVKRRLELGHKLLLEFFAFAERGESAAYPVQVAVED